MSHVGEVSEAQVLAALVRQGYRVLIPWGGSSRYDLVIERDGKFQRVQVKSGIYYNGCVTFRAFSLTGGVFKDYKGSVELFAIYCEGTGGVYLVPIEDVAGTSMALRVTAPRNSQKRKIKWAKDYQIGGIV